MSHIDTAAIAKNILDATAQITTVIIKTQGPEGFFVGDYAKHISTILENVETLKAEADKQTKESTT